jgi:hypothetical protein
LLAPPRGPLPRHWAPLLAPFVALAFFAAAAWGLPSLLDAAAAAGGGGRRQKRQRGRGARAVAAAQKEPARLGARRGCGGRRLGRGVFAAAASRAVHLRVLRACVARRLLAAVGAACGPHQSPCAFGVCTRAQPRSAAAHDSGSLVPGNYSVNERESRKEKPLFQSTAAYFYSHFSLLQHLNYFHFSRIVSKDLERAI